MNNKILPFDKNRPINFTLLKSEPPQTPFAPKYEFIFAEFFLKDIDTAKIAKFILSKEKHIIKKYKVSDKHKSTVDAYTGLGSNSMTSRYEYFNLFDIAKKSKFNELLKLKKQIKEKYTLFLKELKLDKLIDVPVYIQCWANVMRNGQKINTHIHSVDPWCYLGGHFCVQAENTNTYYYNPLNPINDPQTLSSKNVPGKLTIFQNSIPHSTDKYEGNDHRITIAFDLTLEERKSQRLSFIPL